MADLSQFLKDSALIYVITINIFWVIYQLHSAVSSYKCNRDCYCHYGCGCECRRSGICEFGKISGSCTLIRCLGAGREGFTVRGKGVLSHRTQGPESQWWGAWTGFEAWRAGSTSIIYNVSPNNINLTSNNHNLQYANHETGWKGVSYPSHV